MAYDYPDYTRAIQIIGSDVMVPIDLQASYIMMPIDIQAQYITLEIDIVAQTIGNLAVDIAATSIGTMDIDVVAQTVGDIEISIEAQNIGVQLQPDWQQYQGNAKFFRVSGSNQANGDSAAAEYTVTAGKTLYITHFSGSIYATNAADADDPSTCYINVMNNTTPVILAEIGGNGGAGMPLPTPVKIPAGEKFRYQVWNFSNHNCEMYMTAGGYEV